MISEKCVLLTLKLIVKWCFDLATHVLFTVSHIIHKDVIIQLTSM